MSSFPARKNIRLAPLNYVGYQRYFVTMCAFRRQTIFSDSGRCQHLLELLRTECASCNFSVPAYCLMPDHLHFLAEGLDSGSDLLHFLKSFKIKTSRKYAAHEGSTLWQSGFYEHILRSGEDIESVAWYIWLNPVRKQMVLRAQDYPFAGSLTGMKMPADWRPPWK